jgi:hypothetical protein
MTACVALRINGFDTAQRLAFGAAEELFEAFTPAELESLEALLAKFVALPDLKD